MSDAPWKIIRMGKLGRAFRARAQIAGFLATLRPTSETNALPSITLIEALSWRNSLSASAELREFKSRERFERDIAAKSTRHFCCSSASKIADVSLDSS